jgi:hypothetical protein
MFTGGSVACGSAGEVGLVEAGAPEVAGVVVTVVFVVGAVGFAGARVPKVSVGPLAVVATAPVA